MCWQDGNSIRNHEKAALAAVGFVTDGFALGSNGYLLDIDGFWRAQSNWKDKVAEKPRKWTELWTIVLPKIIPLVKDTTLLITCKNHLKEVLKLRNDNITKNKDLISMTHRIKSEKVMAHIISRALAACEKAIKMKPIMSFTTDEGKWYKDRVDAFGSNSDRSDLHKWKRGRMIVIDRSGAGKSCLWRSLKGGSNSDGSNLLKSTSVIDKLECAEKGKETLDQDSTCSREGDAHDMHKVTEEVVVTPPHKTQYGNENANDEVSKISHDSKSSIVFFGRSEDGKTSIAKVMSSALHILDSNNDDSGDNHLLVRTRATTEKNLTHRNDDISETNTELLTTSLVLENNKNDTIDDDDSNDSNKSDDDNNNKTSSENKRRKLAATGDGNGNADNGDGGGGHPPFGKKRHKTREDENNNHRRAQISSALRVRNPDGYRSLEEDTIDNTILFLIDSLHDACVSGNMELALSLVDLGSDINYTDQENRTPMHIAISCGHPKLAMALLERGGDVHARDIRHKTTMHYACVKGYMDVVMALVDRGADVDAHDKWLRTPLHDACRHGHIHVAMALIDKCADVATVNTIKGQRTDEIKYHKIKLMHEQIFAQDEHAFKALLETCVVNNNIDVNTKNTSGWTFLISACIHGNYSIAEYLVKEKDANVALRDNDGMSALHYACDRKNVAIIELLLQNGADINAVDNNHRTSLHWACDSSSPEIAMMLINMGANIHVKDTEEKTPLLWAIDRNHNHLAVELMNRGADINDFDRYKKTALHWACARENMPLIVLLLSKGTNINCQENHDKTPLHYAVDVNRVDIVEILLDNGADVFLQDFRTLTPLHLAAQHGFVDIVEALVRKGGEEIVNKGDYIECTPLHWACLYGQLEVIKTLYDYGVDLNMKSTYHLTPIALASEKGHSHCVEYLVERGANVYVKDDRGHLPSCDDKTIETFNRLWYSTPLMRAMADQNLSEFKRLLKTSNEEDINKDIGDGHGCTVLHAAVHLNRLDFVQQMVKCKKVDFTANTYGPNMLTAMHIACGKNNVRMLEIIADGLSDDRISNRR